MTRYWFTFAVEGRKWQYPYSLLRNGCGVTATSVDDALRLISTDMLEGAPPPPIAQVLENVDVSTLDANHVVPNIGSVVRRGIWFPNVAH